jgi:hypothetical protein
LSTSSQRLQGTIWIGEEDAYWYGWQINSVSTNNTFTNKISVSGIAEFDRRVDIQGLQIVHEYSYTTAKLFFAGGKFIPSLKSDHAIVNTKLTSAQQAALPMPAVSGGIENFLLFKVVKPTNPEVVPGMNWEIKNPLKTFNASTDILFYDGATYDADGNRTNTDSYKITPLRQLEWNNGNGAYLEQLNHAIKLAQATKENQTLNFKNLFGDNLLGDIAQGLLGSNTGGMVPAEIGNTGRAYTIPAGMIAFDIQEASAADPSYINIIVAVNPEQAPSWIGLYGPMGEKEWNSQFNLTTQAIQKFHLPQSLTGTYDSYLSKYATKISGYYTYDDSKKDYNLTSGDYYTYLGGEVVFVGYTFTVTTPGIYLLGSASGPMTVAYFSVDGAAGEGGDGTGGSPLGDIDFVYDNGSAILSVDKKFEGAHIIDAEMPEQFYYPSYYYVRTIPKVASGETAAITVPAQDVYIRRYFIDAIATGQDRRRYIRINNTNEKGTTYVGILDMYEDILASGSGVTTPTS